MRYLCYCIFQIIDLSKKILHKYALQYLMQIQKWQMRKYFANANMLLRKFRYCSPDVKCCMFKSYCSTMYCSSMLFDRTVTSMRKLKIAYNNGLRRILNLPKYNSASEMLVNLSIPSFDELLRKFVYSFKSRIQDSSNSLVNGIVKSSVPLFR